MRHGNFWAVEFVTGGYGNRYSSRQAAEQYAIACNTHSERHSGERVAAAIVRYQEWEQVQKVAI